MTENIYIHVMSDYNMIVFFAPFREWAMCDAIVRPAIARRPAHDERPW